MICICLLLATPGIYRKATCKCSPGPTGRPATAARALQHVCGAASPTQSHTGLVHVQDGPNA